MTLDQKQKSVHKHADDRVEVKLVALNFIEFVVGEQDYLLVNCRDWLRERAAQPRNDHLIVGGMIFNGERHIVIERAMQSSENAELPKPELGDLLTRREMQVALL
jgi:hypothetical protein